MSEAEGAKPRPTGRPSLYTVELGEHICERLMDGESLRQICGGADMPDRVTVLRWLSGDPAFAAKYAQARETQADLMDDKILEEADAATSENAAAVRVKIDAYKWRAAKLQPKKYGDAVQMKHSGAVGVFDPSRLDDEQLATLLATLEPSAAGGSDGGGDQGGTGEAGG